MTRAEAIARINQGIGFRASGNALEANMLLMLQEAQRELEKGKTLPRFLLQEDQTLSLLANTHTVALPTGFIRESDETRIRFFPPTSSRPRFLDRRFYIDAVESTTRNIAGSTLPIEAAPPEVYVIRKSTIDFIVNANQNYTLIWDYYKAADIITGAVTNNAWLDNAPDWLVGEAGWRLAMDLRDNDAVQKFDTMRKNGRGAIFGEEIAAETASAPLQMGANL